MDIHINYPARIKKIQAAMARRGIDLLLGKKGQKCFVEIKNCTLVTDGTAYFPDAVSERGLKHLKELQEQVKKGHRSVMFFLIQTILPGTLKFVVGLKVVTTFGSSWTIPITINTKKNSNIIANNETQNCRKR